MNPMSNYQTAFFSNCRIDISGTYILFALALRQILYTYMYFLLDLSLLHTLDVCQRHRCYQWLRNL